MNFFQVLPKLGIIYYKDALEIKAVSEYNVISLKLAPMVKEDSVVIASELINLVRGRAAQVSHCLLICMSEVKH